MRLWRFFHRSDRDRELAGELQSYLQHETDDLVALGFPRDEAERQARVRLGNSTRIREDEWR